jgi:hypothetical protein
VKVESSQFEYQAAHLATSVDVTIRQSRLRATSPAQPPVADSVSLSPAGASPLTDTELMDPKVLLMKMVAEMLTGHPVQVFRWTPVTVTCCQQAASQPDAAPAVTVQTTQLHYEAEQTTFTAQGVVRTADGREIAFSAELALSREFTSVRTGAAASDPLVVNFGGAPARVTSAKIDFDLNADGKTETIPFVAGGSGLLALDRNGDGKINDGSELFGATTGNGFAELAALDSDGNGWIDEGDPLFAQLSIWTKDGQGNDALTSLQDKGISAIATASVSTEFALKDASNALQAQIRRTGVYLMESGAAGTVQQVDFITG